jgi:hypothetical protein
MPSWQASSQLKIYDEVAHGWQLLIPLAPEATASLKEAASFLASSLSGAATPPVSGGSSTGTAGDAFPAAARR